MGFVNRKEMFSMFAMFISVNSLVSSKYISFNDTPRRTDAVSTARLDADEPSVPGAFLFI